MNATDRILQEKQDEIDELRSENDSLKIQLEILHKKYAELANNHNMLVFDPEEIDQVRAHPVVCPQCCYNMFVNVVIKAHVPCKKCRFGEETTSWSGKKSYKCTNPKSKECNYCCAPDYHCGKGERRN